MIQKVLFFVCVILCLAGCNNTRQIEFLTRSGDPDLDKTASYALHLINKVKKRGGMDSPSKVINYITSTQGSAELTPPSAEYEPDMAALYKGPRPADGVGLSKNHAPPGFFAKEILLKADDENCTVLAEAYKNPNTTPIHKWTWKF